MQAGSVDIGTTQTVLDMYTADPNGWADGPVPVIEVLEGRVTFLGDDEFMPVKDAGMLNSSTGEVSIADAWPFFRTGKTGRGNLGMWGPNQAIDVVVTRTKGCCVQHELAKPSAETVLDKKLATIAAESMGIQIGVVPRHGAPSEWALPGMFVTSVVGAEGLVSIDDRAERAQVRPRCLSGIHIPAIGPRPSTLPAHIFKNPCL